MKTTILPSKEFDTGTRTAATDVLNEMQRILAEAKAVGLVISELTTQAKTADRSHAPAAMQALHDGHNVTTLRQDCGAIRRTVRGKTTAVGVNGVGDT